MIDKQKAIELKESGLTNKEVAMALDCSEDWCKRNLKGIKKKDIKKRVFFEVYVAYSIKGLLYVGSGKQGRHKHCLSGKSTSKYLNIAVFNNEDIIVEVVAKGLTKEDSLTLEQYLINDLNPKFNVRKAVTNNMKVTR